MTRSAALEFAAHERVSPSFRGLLVRGSMLLEEGLVYSLGWSMLAAGCACCAEMSATVIVRTFIARGIVA